MLDRVGKRRVGSAGLTVLIIVSLLVLAPASSALSFTIIHDEKGELDGGKTIEVEKGETVTLTTKIRLEDPDNRVPIDHLQAKLWEDYDAGQTALTPVDFTVYGEEIEELSWADVAPVSTDAGYGYGYGYADHGGYGYDFGYGYGYGYAGDTQTLTYDITIDTSELEAGKTYEFMARLITTEGEQNFASARPNIEVTSGDDDDPGTPTPTTTATTTTTTTDDGGGGGGGGWSPPSDDDDTTTTTTADSTTEKGIQDTTTTETRQGGAPTTDDTTTETMVDTSTDADTTETTTDEDDGGFLGVPGFGVAPALVALLAAALLALRRSRIDS